MSASSWSKSDVAVLTHLQSPSKPLQGHSTHESVETVPSALRTSFTDRSRLTYKLLLDMSHRDCKQSTYSCRRRNSKRRHDKCNNDRELHNCDSPKPLKLCDGTFREIPISTKSVVYDRKLIDNLKHDKKTNHTTERAAPGRFLSRQFYLPIPLYPPPQPCVLPYVCAINI